MRKIISAPTHTLVSLPNPKLAALARVLSDALAHSDLTAQNCPARVGVSLEELHRLQREIAEIVAAAGTDAPERFVAEREGFSLQLMAISALGTPADLSYHDVFRKISSLEDLPPAA